MRTRFSKWKHLHDRLGSKERHPLSRWSERDSFPDLLPLTFFFIFRFKIPQLNLLVSSTDRKSFLEEILSYRFRFRFYLVFYSHDLGVRHIVQAELSSHPLPNPTRQFPTMSEEKLMDEGMKTRRRTNRSRHRRFRQTQTIPLNTKREQTSVKERIHRIECSTEVFQSGSSLASIRRCFFFLFFVSDCSEPHAPS